MEGDSSTELMDFSKLKVPELKKELKARGLSTSGNKNELLERLQSSLKAKSDNNGDGSRAESVDELDEDLLNDDDDEHLDGSDTVLGDIDGALDVSTTEVKGTKRPSDINDKLESEPPKAKKIVLNRTPSGNSEVQPSNGASKSIETLPKTSLESNEDVCSEKKVIKLSDVGAKERLELRAKKFGVEPPSDIKKQARAERFGIVTSTTNTTATTAVTEGTKKISLSNATPNLDALKSRAQRFGGSVSSIMSKMEEQEKLEKRKQRFGLATATSNNGTAQTDKAKMRLERFKQSS